MRHTQSATELTSVQIEPVGPGANVWLRQNIHTVEIDLGDGLSQTMWEADEVFGYVGSTITAAEVEADFDGWWDTFEHIPKSDSERLADAESGIAMLGDGLAELSGVVSDEHANMSDVMDALAELSEIVSDLAGGEQ